MKTAPRATVDFGRCGEPIAIRTLKYDMQSLISEALRRLSELNSNSCSKGHTDMLIREMAELRALAYKYENDKLLMDLQ